MGEESKSVHFSSVLPQRGGGAERSEAEGGVMVSDGFTIVGTLCKKQSYRSSTAPSAALSGPSHGS